MSFGSRSRNESFLQCGAACPCGKDACKKGVDFGIADWNTTRDLSSIRREEIEASMRKALERCHDRYPGGFDQLPIRTACQRGVRRVREYALGQLELFQGRAPSLRGSRGATGSESSVSETARKSYEIDAERLRQIQESFRNRGGGGSPPPNPHAESEAPRSEGGSAATQGDPDPPHPRPGF